MGYQYTNLQSYFMSLNDIFEGNASQKVKEESYEKGVKVGIQMHSETLRYGSSFCCQVFVICGRLKGNIAKLKTGQDEE